MEYLIKFILDYFILHRYQIIRFIIIGIVTFIINFLSFHYFYDVWSLNYKIATSCAYTITVISHFLLHRIFTFKVRKDEQQLKHNVAKYFIMLGINYLITITVMWFTVEIIRVSAYIGLVAATAATASSSFFTMKYFVFSQAKLTWSRKIIALDKNKCVE